MNKLWIILGLLCLVGYDAAGDVSEPQVLHLTVPWTQGSRAMSELRTTARGLRTKTDGRVRVRFSERQDPGNEAEGYDGGLLAGPYLGRRSAAARVFALPFLFRTQDELAALRDLMDTKVTVDLQAAGLQPVASLDLGFAYLLSRVEVYSVEHLKDCRMWVPEDDPDLQRILEGFGLRLEPLGLTQVREGLRAGQVDTVLAPPLGAILLQWHTEITHVTDMPCSYLGGVLVLREGALDSLAPADRDLVRSELAAAFDEVAADLRQRESEALEVLEQNQVQRQPLGKTDEQREAWYAWAEAAADALARDGLLCAEVLNQAKAALRSSSRTTSSKEACRRSISR